MFRSCTVKISICKKRVQHKSLTAPQAMTSRGGRAVGKPLEHYPNSRPASPRGGRGPPAFVAPVADRDLLHSRGSEDTLFVRAEIRIVGVRHKDGRCPPVYLRGPRRIGRGRITSQRPFPSCSNGDHGGPARLECGVPQWDPSGSLSPGWTARHNGFAETSPHKGAD